MILKNGQELTIRKAIKGDAKEVLDYLNIVGGESDNLLFGANGFTMTVQQEEEIIESTNNSKTSVFLVGLIDNKIVSIGSIFSPKRERVAHQGNLGISVLKRFWGIGIGTRLMEAMIDFAKDSQQLEILHLAVKADNCNAIAMYKKLGFQQIGLYPKFYKINGLYYDDILMNLYLAP